LPEKEKRYIRVKFSPGTIKKARAVLQRYVPELDQAFYNEGNLRETRTALESWTFETDDEFFSEYRKEIDNATIRYMSFTALPYMRVAFDQYSTDVTVTMPERHKVEAVFETFEDAYSRERLPEPELPKQGSLPRPKVFIGHGRSSMWRELSEHLKYLQGFDVEAYEFEPRAGLSIKEVLQDLLRKASFALLVHTAEDEQADGQLRARQNVVHETGLFQGKLGFERAIVLREENCEGFSNHTGINELRFATNNIREIYGDVVAILNREFPRGS